MKFIFVFLGLCCLVSGRVAHPKDTLLFPRSYPESPHTLSLKRKVKHHHTLPRSLDRRDDAIFDSNQTKFLTEVDVNGQTFELEIDTGSSDTWIVTDNFVCEAKPGGSSVDESTCNFGPTLDISSGFTKTAGYFDSCYGSAPHRCVAGLAGVTDIEIAGITIPKQTIAAITLSSGFVAQGSIDEQSGLMGLGYRALTRRFKGTKLPSTLGSETCDDILSYSPIIETMFNDPTVTPPLASKAFSIAISRDESNNSYGGVMSFGGLPVGAYTDPTINATDTVAIAFTKTNKMCSTDALSYYSIVLDGFLVGNTTYNKNQQVIIDSGSPYINAPTKSANAFNAGWDPPIDSYNSVDCDATNPLQFCLVIKGVELCINPVDLKNLNPNGYCYSSIQAENDPSFMLMGDTFLKNVIAIFEWDPDAIGFYYRPYYES